MFGEFDIATYKSDGWLVNDHPVDESVAEHLNERAATLVWGMENCPLCASPLVSRGFNDVADGNDTWHYDRTYSHYYCSNCAYWEFNGAAGGNKCMDPHQTVLVSSVTKKFDLDLPEGCFTELAQDLRRNPHRWHSLNPKRMEKLVAEIFRANHETAEVIHVGKPCDGGVDVVFVECSGTRWLIQVKRREKPEEAEGFSTLQNILGTLVLENERHGIIVSTSDSFSYYAERARARAAEFGFTIRFIDKGILHRMIGELLPGTPWGAVFATNTLSHIEAEVQQHFWPEFGGQKTLF